jgi:hypothetical protein
MLLAGRTSGKEEKMRVQDEQTTPIRVREEEFQEPHDDRQPVSARSAIFGGLAGGVFLIGLAVAILSGHFWPVFLVALAITSLLGPLGSSKAQAIYGGFQGCVFFLGLAICSLYNWWWPGILVLLGIEAILGIGNGLLAAWSVVRPGTIAEQYYAALRDQDYVRAYQYLGASLTALLSRERFISLARQHDAEEGPVSSYTYAPDLHVTTIPLAGEPLPLITFTRDPAEHLTVTVQRAHAPSYLVHLLVRRVGKAWKISAFDRI